MTQAPHRTFHAFTTRFGGITDRIVTPVSLFAFFNPEDSPPTLEYRTKGLWDTGATRSVISHATVMAMGLIPVGAGMVETAGGSDEVSTYLINVRLPNGVGIPGVMVSGCKGILGDNVGALIGMDIICQGDFSITNLEGETCFSYRFPSVKTIDYVAEAQVLKGVKANPNDRCPCGSGKKFKKCCGLSA